MEKEPNNKPTTSADDNTLEPGTMMLPEGPKKAKVPNPAGPPAHADRTLGGRKPGSRPKSLQAIQDIMDEHGFNPVEMSLKIVKGEVLTEDHPFLKTLYEYICMIEGHCHEDDGRGVLTRCKELWNTAKNQLADCYTPIELRSKHILELMNYLHPKKKAIEITAASELQGSAVPLTPADVLLFEEWFNREFK